MSETKLNCENDCERLASNDPEALAQAMKTMAPPLLTFAAEHLGAAPASVALPALLPLLRHDRPYVREGAIYGLASHRAEPGVTDALREVADGDASEAIRQIAAEALDGAGSAGPDGATEPRAHAINE